MRHTQIIDGLVDQIEMFEVSLGKLVMLERDLQDGGSLDLHKLHTITYELQDALAVSLAPNMEKQ